MNVRLTILLGALVAFFVSVSSASSPAVAAPAQVGPVDVTGQIDGAPFRIIVPAAWNGKLIVFAHGYDDKADHPGEVEVRGPFQGGTGPTLATLLGQGWAVAGTAYKDNGWVVKDGLEDVVALASQFTDTIASPARTYLWGFSMGSVVTLETAERNGGAFDGYIAACGIGAGVPRGADWLLSLMLAYDTAFGAPASWGALGDVRDDLDFETEVVPLMLPQIFNPANFARFEFIRLVAGLRAREWQCPRASSRAGSSMTSTSRPRPPPSWNVVPGGTSCRTSRTPTR
jgi:pimeloyl-ACP methyl ester carboxylesterase